MKKTYQSGSLTPNANAVLNEKATEYPHTGRYNRTEEKGTYLCRQCGLAIFRSSSKFISACGWPSFDDEIQGAISYITDQDGKRTEILCSRCGGHLGHVFKGEGYTAKNLRHCVNSLSLDFVRDLNVLEAEEAIFAGGCFWGVQTLLNQNKGVLYTEVGYTGGTVVDPSYEVVCRGQTGHFEAIRVLFDPEIIDYETLAKDFFNIHDPTQAGGQGPDHGSQYQSAIFYHDEHQKNSAQKLVNELTQKGLNIKTQLLPVSAFWPAEDYHQDYYDKTGKAPYCHVRVKRL
jgi:peptide methionine sulfoxide reductase msrA/msrB